MKEQTLERGQTLEVTFESLAPGGEGVTKDYGIPIFVDRVAAGDKALIEVFDVRSNFARGKLVEVIEPSADRAEPPCKLFKVCGGCQWQHLSYEGQLSAKKKIVEQALAHVGKLSPDLVRDPIGATKTLHYRNKAQFPVRHPHKSSRILAGYYKQDSHDLINIKHCPIQPSELDDVLDHVKAICEAFHITAYDEKKGKGLLRFINLRVSEAHNKVLATLVLNCKPENLPSSLRKLAQELLNQNENVSGVCANFNTSRGNRILGFETECLAGDAFIEEILKSDDPQMPAILQKGLKFRLSSTAFFQVNTEQAQVLLKAIADAILAHAPDLLDLKQATLIDAFCGVGAISLWLAPFVKRVIGIEENVEAIDDAEYNAGINNTMNAEFITGKVEEILPQLVESGERPEIIVVDPPRKGCAPETLSAIAKLAPKLIVYVSCNPVTLARDLKTLQSLPIEPLPNNQEDAESSYFGYKTLQVLPIDLFPQTYHIESVSVLIRQSLKDNLQGHVEKARKFESPPLS